MRKKLSITLDERVYDGLHTVVGRQLDPADSLIEPADPFAALVPVPVGRMADDRVG